MAAANSAIILAKQVETTWGEKPAVPDMTTQRVSSASFTLNRAELEDDSITGTRGVPSVRYGNQDATGSISGSLAYDNWDELMASACQNDWAGNVLSSDGIAEKSFTFEIGRTDISKYELWTGVQVGSMTVTSPIDGLTTISFECNAKGLDSINDSAVDLEVTSQPATEAMFHCGGVISYGDSGSVPTPIAVITSVDFTIENGLENQFGWGACQAQDITSGKSRVSGTLSAMMEDTMFQDDSLSENDVIIEFTLNDPSGNSLTFSIPKAKLGSVDAPIEAEGATVLTIPFRGQFDPVSGATVLITRS